MESHADTNPRSAQEPSPEVLPSVLDAMSRLLAYCEANDWAGYDPYDALNSELFKSLPVLDRRVPRLVMTQALKRLPVNVRPLLRIPKTQNAKGLALVLASFVKLSKIGLLDRNERISEMVEQLAAHRSPDTPRWCWGYSFPWQTRTKVVPRGTPNLVCTIFVGNALLDAHEARREAGCLEMALGAAEYILQDLYWCEGTELAGFAYPLPSMRQQIHNANLLAAAFFCRVSALSGEGRFREPAFEVARFSAAKQRNDGSWLYGELPIHQWVDNFHTGYNLCALRDLDRHAGTDEFETHVRRGLEFYRTHFFREDGAPRYFHNRTYPIDVHCVAQSIITLLVLKDLDRDNVRLAHAVFRWSMNCLWDERGYFYYQQLRWLTNRIPYMRWAEAWMLLALCSLLEDGCGAGTPG